MGEGDRAGRSVAYDFDQGLPDPALFPVPALRHYFDRVFVDDGPGACHYFAPGHPEDMRYGHRGLRAAIADWLNANEHCALGPENVTLANGSTDGIAMAINALVGPGDLAVVEDPTYPYARQFIATAGGTVATVPVDGDGMVVEEIEARFEAAAASGLRPRLVYTIATFHSPTGTVLGEGRRRLLIELAERWGAMILDDNCYYHLYYDEPPPPSLLGLDQAPDGPIIQSGSFSKYLAPGLRLAWLAGPAPTIAAVAAARQDFAVSQITARAIEGLVRDGVLDEHLGLLRTAYREKRDRALSALGAHCRPLAEFGTPAGGFYFWLRVSERVDFADAMARAEAAGVRLRPGVRFTDGVTGARCLRLSVAQTPVADIEPGIRALGTAFAEASR